MKEKIQGYIKSLGFDWTDLSIIPFFVFTIIFILEDVRLMSINIDINLSQPLWAFIVYFVIAVISLYTFLFFEFKKGRRPHIAYLGIVTVFFIFSILAISLNPNTISTDFLDIDDNVVNIVTNTSGEAKFIHIASFLFFIGALFTWVFIIPKKFKNYSFVTLICYLFYLTTLFVIIYSFVNDSFKRLIEIFQSETLDYRILKLYLPRSIFGNPNGYAVFLELGLFISLLHHALKKWKIDYLFVFIYYLFIFSTLCRTAIAASTILLIAYLVTTFIRSLIKKNKGEVIGTSAILSGLFLVFLILLILYLTNGFIQSKINALLSLNGGFTGRDYIWYLAKQLFTKKIVIGNGHGIYNHILVNATAAITGGEGTITSHNSFIAMLGEGGIIYLLFYISLIAYSVYLIYKMVKKDFELSLVLIFGLLLYLVHSVFEDIYYYSELIIVFTAICFNANKYQSIKQTEKSIENEA